MGYIRKRFLEILYCLHVGSGCAWNADAGESGDGLNSVNTHIVGNLKKTLFLYDFKENVREYPRAKLCCLSFL